MYAYNYGILLYVTEELPKFLNPPPDNLIEVDKLPILESNEYYIINEETKTLAVKQTEVTSGPDKENIFQKVINTV